MQLISNRTRDKKVSVDSSILELLTSNSNIGYINIVLSQKKNWSYSQVHQFPSRLGELGK